MKRFLVGLCFAALLCLPVHAGQYEIAFISKVAGIPFFDVCNDGAQEAAKELGVKVTYVNPVDPTAEAQIEVIESQILRGVSAVTISANDTNALVPVCQKATSEGILATSWDSGIAPAGSTLFIESADMKGVANTLMDVLWRYMKGEGEYAILSAGAQMTVQNTIIARMKEVAAEDPGKYGKMKLVTIVYGDDVMDKSYQEATGLLTAYPNLKGIISPTSIGVIATAQAVEDRGLIGKCFVTGTGLASQAVTMIKSGSMPELALWNPRDIGYLTIYANEAILSKKITPKAGEKFKAGRLGEFTIGKTDDGGLSVVQRNVILFTKDNIDEWAPKL